MENDKRNLSEKNRPTYIKWALKTRKSEVALTLLGLIACFFATPVILDPANDNPIGIMVLAFTAIYGFTVGMALQPYMIYRKLRKSNWWADNKS